MEDVRRITKLELHPEKNNFKKSHFSTFFVLPFFRMSWPSDNMVIASYVASDDLYQSIP